MSIVNRTEPQSLSPDYNEPRFGRVEVTDEYITAYLTDDRVVSVPLWWSWRLEAATAAQRSNYELIGAGHTAYWPDVDEHLSVQGFLFGTPAPRPNMAEQ
jgi:hypothetical protein